MCASGRLAAAAEKLGNTCENFGDSAFLLGSGIRRKKSRPSALQDCDGSLTGDVI